MATYTINDERPELSTASSTTALYHGEPGDKHAIHPVPAAVVDTAHSRVGHRCPITEQPPRPPLESRDTKNILCDLNEPVDETATAYTTIEGARQNAIPTPRVEKTGMDWGNTSTAASTTSTTSSANLATGGAPWRPTEDLNPSLGGNIATGERIPSSASGVHANPEQTRVAETARAREAAVGAGAGAGRRTEEELVKGVQGVNIGSGAATDVGAGTPWRSTGDVDISKNAMGGKGVHVDAPTSKTSTTDNLVAKTEQSPATAPTAGWAAPPTTDAGSGSTTTATYATAEAKKETLGVEETNRRKSSTSSGKSGSSGIFGKIKDAIIG
ncbi:hypothetical protein G7K_6634-t1 [Saitoella complicata NRRL Y-17804]|uniref:Uncharacterized protein n=2 Tax=Saitoella complicata (strain BCRC 22490 / CBS 7301 / JCM 7358 / NBRC 10748 / NRRL Y-17804) TaxID=698492 RepID=A0A0E9NSC9_SAICN|nr:hypothetical protein G7K_6634-t1 [Saitoella complicata NRRL Y-17804]